MAENSAPEISSLSFEAALAELEQIVAKLESGQAPLQQSIKIYERGQALKAHCEKLLEAAEAKIEKITLNKAGEASGVVPLDE